MPKGKKKQSEEKRPSSESDSDMTQMLELSYKEFKITIIDMLRVSMEKVDGQHIRSDGQCKQRDNNYERIKRKGYKSKPQ
jgi:hypothetical protein